MSKSVSSTVDEDLFQRAQAMTGAGQAETIRRALEHFVSSGPDAASATTALPTAQAAAPLAGAKPVADMSDSEELASMRLLLRASDALGDAIVYLAGEEAVADTAERKRLRIIIGDLTADKAKADARINALQAGQLTMVPPSDAMVEKVAELAEKVGELTRTAQQADLVIAAVKQVVEIWTGTQTS